MIVNFNTIGLYDWSLILGALLIICMAVARLNDIKRTQVSKRWWFRRVGLLMVFVSMVMFVAAYFTLAAEYWDATCRFLGVWGFALTWVTTPYQAPFWKYISRNDPKE